MKAKKILLITGVAGFVGFHTANNILKNKYFEKIIGIDNLNSYYDKNLKISRVKVLLNSKTNFIFKKIDITNSLSIQKIITQNKITHIIHLAAQAGVRFSIHNPKVYLKTNIIGFQNLLDISVKNSITHFVYASSSSVYGDKNRMPLSEDNDTNKPLSYYAASKKTNEIIAHSYSSIYKLPTTGLRFFTAYGTYGRPDMSYYKFVDHIYNNKEIKLYNYGRHSRDFTHINDLSKIINKVIKKTSKNKIPYEIYNIGSSKKIELKTLVSTIEKYVGKQAKIKFIDKQLGDVRDTLSSISKIKKDFKYKPSMKFENGIKEFINWYKNYHNK